MTSTTRTRLSRREFLGIGGGLAAVAALAGCGATPPATGPQPQAANLTTGHALEQWYHQYGERGTREAVERYAASYPGRNVEVTWKAGDYDQAVETALAGRADGVSSGPPADTPDVFEFPNGPTIDMIRGGQVADLTDVIGDAVSDFDPALIRRVTYDGRLWAVPQVADMQLLVYRPSLLARAGVKPPTTVDELIDAAAATTRGTVKGLFLGNDGGASIMGAPMLRSAGFDLLTEDGRFGFDDPRAAEALRVLRRLFTSGHVLLDAPTDWFAAGALTGGLAAMQFTGLWTLPEIRKALGDDVGVLPWPAMPGGSPNVSVGAYGACVSARSPRVEEAKAYVRWLWVDGTDKQTDFATSYGLHVPARRSVAANATALKQGQAAEAVDLGRRHGFPQRPLLWTPTCAQAFDAMMADVVGRGTDPAARIPEVRRTVEAELARVRS